MISQEEERYCSYLEGERNRVRIDCGNDYQCDQATSWTKEQSAVWDTIQEERYSMRGMEDRAIGIPARRRQSKNAAKYPGWDQMLFMRDTVMNGIFRDDREYHLYPPGETYDNQVGGQLPELFVVGQHVSKQVTLPVLQFQWKDIMITTRYNFHDWKVSVRLPEPISLDDDLLNIGDADHLLLRSVYFEGFPAAYIYPPIAANDYPITAQFSMMFGDQFKLYTFFWLILRWYNNR